LEEGQDLSQAGRSAAARRGSRNDYAVLLSNDSIRLSDIGHASHRMTQPSLSMSLTFADFVQATAATAAPHPAVSKLSMTKADSTLIIEVDHQKELLSAMCINHM